MKILLLEDSQMGVRICLKYLAQMNLNDVVIATEGGHQGIQTVNQLLQQQQVFDLILCDINMPVMDGIGFVQHLKSLSAYAEVPVIMITGAGEKEKVVAAFEAGARFYIVKPYTLETLSAKIKQALSTPGQSKG